MQKWSRLVCHSQFFCFLQLRHGRYKCHYGIPLRSRQIPCLEGAFSLMHRHLAPIAFSGAIREQRLLAL